MRKHEINKRIKANQKRRVSAKSQVLSDINENTKISKLIESDKVFYTIVLLFNEK